MAEIQIPTSSKYKGLRRSVKKSTRVDLTPMVDLVFLLITFFMFTSALSRPKVMDLVTPMDSNVSTPVCASCVLTVILDEENRIRYYEGMPESDPVIRETSFTPEGIRALLLEKRAAVKTVKGTADDMVVIIKPSARSVYKTLFKNEDFNLH